MPTPIPVESYPLLMGLVNQTYLDQVEQITAAQVNDDDSITFVGLDNPKKIAGKITDNDISMKLMTTGQKPQFAAPKKKPKNCSSPTSISCGLTCLPAKTKAGKDTVCKKPLSPNQKNQKKSIVESAKKSKQPKDIPDYEKEAIAQKADQQKADKKINEKVSKSLKESGVDGASVAEGQSLTEKEKALLEENLLFQPKEKVARLIADGMDKYEASGTTDYIGSAYREMNALFWDKDAKKKLGDHSYELNVARVKAASSGLRKLPPVTADALDSLVSKGHKSALPYSGGVLTHGLKLEGVDLDSFVEKHKLAAKSGSPVEAGKFLSTAWNEGGHPGFMSKANVEIAVTAKMDGSGSGRLVDQYKNHLFENEILFPPDTKFKVTKVEQVKATRTRTEFVDGIEHTPDHKSLTNLAALLDPDAAVMGKGFYSPKNFEGTFNIFANKKFSVLSKEYGLGKPPVDPNPVNVSAYKAKISAAIALEAQKAKAVKVSKVINGKPARLKIHYEEI
jgi:hypothetical protein